MNQAAPQVPTALAYRPRLLRSLESIGSGGAHAYLFCSDDDDALQDIATWIAQRAVCPNGGGDECSVCARIVREVHPDVHRVRAEGSELAIEQIRQLVDQLVRRPFEADVQVAVIDGADSLDAMNAATGNALLKVLEEPPGPVLFVLLARRVARVLPTLRSRAVELPLVPLSTADMTAELERIDVSDAQLAERGFTREAIIRIARGNGSRLRSLATGTDAHERRRVALAVASGLCGGALLPADAADALDDRCAAVADAEGAEATREFEALAERLPEREARRFRNSKESDGMERRVRRRSNRVAVRELTLLLEEMLWWYRDLLTARAGGGLDFTNADRADEIVRLAHCPAAEHAIAAIDAIEEAALRAGANVDRNVALTALCAELASLAEGRIRSRRTLGALARTPQNYELSLG